MTDERFIFVMMRRLCLKSNIEMEVIAENIGLCLGKFLRKFDVDDEKQVEISELLNKGLRDGLFK